MSIGIGSFGGIAASVAGTSLAQAKGSEIERAGQDAGANERVAQSEQKAESAAGVGETNGQDHETSERDADGRLPWRMGQLPEKTADDAAAAPPSKDSTGQSGNLLDLSG
jgi:hypothetical protein